ncbi:MAG: TetR/AcrR family transcriptional regulator [Rhizobiales bacterium]|nr:TetR/AcrR family transcriptional regulator [Hyphomicrobiales bacterium]
MKSASHLASNNEESPAGPVHDAVRKRHDDHADSACCNAEQGRIRLPAGQDPAKRRQILEGAQNVFLRMGYDAATMNDITREAGVSKGTIYVYFNNKDELFVELCDHYRQTVFSSLVDTMDNGFSTREELIDFGVALTTLITSETAIRGQRIVIGVSERKPELAARFYERGPRRKLQSMVGCLNSMIAEGVFEPFDTERAAYQLSDLFLSGLYRPRLFGVLAEEPSEATIRANVEAAVDLFFRAYGRRG